MQNDLDNLPKIPDNFNEYLTMFHSDQQYFTPGSKNDKIFKLSAPYDNPYQGSRPRILFACSAGLLRSPTGAQVASDYGYNTRACGTAQRYALIPLSVNLIHWAHKIVFVEDENYREAVDTFTGSVGEGIIEDKALIAGIPDIYNAFSPDLVFLWREWIEKNLHNLKH